MLATINAHVLIATQSDVIDADTVGGVQREDTTDGKATSNVEASWVPTGTNESNILPYIGLCFV